MKIIKCFKTESIRIILFSYDFGYSRTRYIEFVTDMTANTLIRCHVNTFRYFGGYPESNSFIFQIALNNNVRKSIILIG
ncbi:MAG TPA: hypothetical protein DIC60_04350 [Lachnospiraceae bacterium]|nr:hypothetical protein [Lachnospiraceae bacterium]